MASVIYTLLLQGGRYYVGRTNQLEATLSAHMAGQGSEWTAHYPVVQTIEVVNCTSEFHELQKTLEMMSLHGMDNVRGASYLAPVLPDHQVDEIRRHLGNAQNRCHVCGNPNHFASACTERRGSDRTRQGSQSISQQNPFALSRDGRGSAIRFKVLIVIALFAGGLLLMYAMGDAHGKSQVKSGYFDTDEVVRCARCGRTSHTIETCYARTDRYGNELVDYSTRSQDREDYYYRKPRDIRESDDEDAQNYFYNDY